MLHGLFQKERESSDVAKKQEPLTVVMKFVYFRKEMRNVRKKRLR